ncbi:putative nuclease HARBI1 [Gossypium hirsutum]|uniref:Nuclease HARBI1 n=1 Tax=Gossypium hirsutum TaxID=3635 RepID=A0ABM2YYK3_GOSHI|nr:putative nuclease HARBI1 [Gossypium hirsutum]
MVLYCAVFNFENYILCCDVLSLMGKTLVIHLLVDVRQDSVVVSDGTHVRASVPPSIEGRFRSRKGGTTQNVLAAITFDLKFSYVLASWEGSAHDSRILSDALSRPRGLRILKGKYYLADAGYGIRNGFITPYRGVRYHLKEFSAQGPENAKELFNLRHSSLRITIERVFGILKKRFRVLDAEPFWNFQTQVDIVLVCCIIHNHIMGVDPNDLLNQGLYDESESDLIMTTLTEREEREEAREWSAKRDEIAQTMWIDYMARNIR